MHEVQCDVYCEMKVGNETKVLRKDDEVMSEDDPCRMYKCIGRNELQAKEVVCPNITSCKDKKAPYFLPGSCCLTCRKHVC